MSFGLSLTYVHALRSPMTDSIFPKLQILLEDTEYQKALEYVASKKDQDRYKSTIDFIHAELYGGWRKAACFRYYEDKGCLYKDNPRVTPEMITLEEKEMMLAMEVALQQMQEEREQSWIQFRKQWQRIAA